MSVREEARMGASVVVWAALGTVLLVLLIILGTAIYQHFETGLENQHTTNIRQTNQYVTSQQQHLVSLYADYRDLDTRAAVLGADPANANAVSAMRDQQRAIITEMRRTAVTLEPAQVPVDVAVLLSQNR